MLASQNILVVLFAEYVEKMPPGKIPPGKNTSCIFSDPEKMSPQEKSQQYFKTEFIVTTNNDPFKKIYSTV